MSRPRKKPSLWPMAGAILLLMAASGAWSRDEARYLWFGRRVGATVVSSARVLTGQIGSRGRQLLQSVEFTYRDHDGNERHGHDFVTEFWKVPEVEGTVPIDYIPGRDDSARVAGNGAKLAPAFFLMSCVSLAAVGGVAAVEYRSRVQRRERRQRREEEDEAVKDHGGSTPGLG